jgi:DnaJ-class molecular chaperone
MKDYYRILGVVEDAEDVVPREAYKALAQRYRHSPSTDAGREFHRRK